MASLGFVSVKFSGIAILADKIKGDVQGPSRTLTVLEPDFRFYIAFSMGNGVKRVLHAFFETMSGIMDL